ncbi:MAG TPA: hypothetical protein VFG23_26405 [Polyangia bacterium]|nr:hypothetical protein [Polyangia bacterium]
MRGFGKTLPLFFCLGLGGGLSAGGCAAKQPEATDGTVFIATISDFQDFQSWHSAPAMPATTLPPIDGGDGVDAGTVTPDAGTVTPDAGAVHVLPLTVYWNNPPPHGSTTFPVGTIIVKETSETDPTARKIFAMVKRGGDFDPNGAVNWEWYELYFDANGNVDANWYGVGPNGGSTDPYAANPNICNACHLKAAANDDVWSSALQLSNF